MVMPSTAPLLDDAECDRVHELVLALRRYWTARHPELPSFTLGAAAYLDIPDDGIRQYYARTTRANRPLRRDLDWLYDRLLERVAELLGAPTTLTQNYAPPGFHIFEWHERLGELVPKLHFDLQHEDLDWTESPNDDPTRRFSFTVPIDLPSGGAGVYMWPITREETFGKSVEELEALYAAHASTYHPYRRGELFVHDGNHLHQIAADRVMYEGERRLTFQGHGVLADGAWQLYW